MDITQFKYLITIVESDYNISSAAKKLYTSQSTISQVVLNIEKESNQPLFIREKGRLRALSPFGQFVYNEAIKIVEIYDAMMERVHSATNNTTCTLKVGVPELIVKVYLQDFFIEFMSKNPNIRLEILELGSKDIAAMLEKNLLDIAILVEPTMLNPSRFNNQAIILDELVAYIPQTHELNAHDMLDWPMLEKTDLALFHSDFITHQLVAEKLSQSGLDSNRISVTSSSWRFLVNMCLNNNMMTLFASQTRQSLEKKGLVSKRFLDPIPFNVSIWSHKRDRNITIEEQFINELLIHTNTYMHNIYE